MDNRTTAELITAIQQGDHQAFSTIYDTFYNDIYYFILKTIKDPELAADLTQETFIEILETIGNLRIPSAFVPWSKKIAYHKCTAFLRKKRDLLADEREDGYSLLDLRMEDRWEFIPDESIDHVELQKTICEMIDALPEEQRTAIVLRYYDELSIKDIAKIQKTSEGTIKSRLSYGRKTIKASVEEYEKKNHIQLHCVGVVPILLWFFKNERLSKGLSLTEMTPIAEAFASVITKSTKDLFKKIIAGFMTALLVTGSANAALSKNFSADRDTEIDVESDSIISSEWQESDIYETSDSESSNNDTHITDNSELTEDEIPTLSNSELPEDKSPTLSNSESIESETSTPNSSTSSGNESSHPAVSTPTDTVIPDDTDSLVAEKLILTLSSDASYYIVKGFGTYTDEHLTIPSEYKGLPVTTIQKGDYANTTISHLTIPSSITYIEPGAIQGVDNLSEIVVSKENPVYHSSGNCIIDTYGKSLVLGCKNSVIPVDDSVHFIAAYSFYNCTGLTQITIPDNITHIYENAFYNCNKLTDIYLSDNIQYISEGSFDSTSAKSIYYDGTHKQWDNVSKSSFIARCICYVYCCDGVTYTYYFTS